jgi:pimeloyl-ACP methyl ester carboxylesterase
MEDDRMTAPDWSSQTRGDGAYADVNGLHLYYETHGDSGPPLILLHGGLGSGEMFGPVLAALATNRRVIVPDLQGHGRTADIERPIDVRLMAGDIIALTKHLGLERPDLVGYSLGGGTAFHAAVQAPELFRRLVIASVYLRPDFVHDELRAMQGQIGPDAAELMKDTPMYQLYERVAPRPEDFPRVLGKLGAVMSEDFDYTEDFKRLAIPTMLVAADADQFPPKRAAEMFELLDGGLRDGGWMHENRPKGGHALAILPGLTHYDIFSSPLFAAVTLAFLDAPDAAAPTGGVA